MAKAPGGTIEIELVYALAREQIVEKFRVQAGTDVNAAIEQSGILLRYPAIATGSLIAGIYGRRVPVTRILREFDRIEIYRPLTADPKQARRTRARKTATPKR